LCTASSCPLSTHKKSKGAPMGNAFDAFDTIGFLLAAIALLTVVF
jgi:hypothetical protein